MSKLRVGVIDIVSRGPTRAWFPRVMHANMASIMPQVIATWCAREGHDVAFCCYCGFENLAKELPDNVDLVFIGAFTEAAHTAYALSNYYRSKGAITALGGPHARCYPHDARRFFDYVFGFTDRDALKRVLDDCSQHRPYGIHVAAPNQPAALPGVRERWPYQEQVLRKSPILKMIPTIGSLGCPYTCSFCIDSTIPYQPLEFQVMKEDLRFLLTKYKRPGIVWHDPNFGVRFDDYMEAIAEADPEGKARHIAESSLSLLSEPRLKILKKNGFQAILPGVESWFDLGNKSKTGACQGMAKVKQVSEHINMILRYIPYLQANFVLGIDADEGPEPFECTKRFLDMTPGAFPGYSLLTAFGQAAPMNLEYQRAGRVLGFPFFFLNNNGCMNVRPKNYDWRQLYDHVIDLVHYSFSWRMIGRRFMGTSGFIPKWMNVLRAVSTEGAGRLRYYREIRRRLDADPEFLPYFNQETTKLPRFYTDLMRRELGNLWNWVPEGGFEHDAYAYVKSIEPRHPAVKAPRRQAAVPAAAYVAPELSSVAQTASVGV